MNDNTFQLHKNQNEFAIALGTMKAHTEDWLALYAYKAKMVRAYYQELLEQGFSETQAIDLCKNFSISQV